MGKHSTLFNQKNFRTEGFLIINPASMTEVMFSEKITIELCIIPKNFVMKELLKNSLKSSFNYPEYLDLLDELVQNKSTTGEPTQDRIDFTALNFKRVQRLNKTIKLDTEQQKIFNNLKTKQTWLVFLESWCADGAQTIPVLNKIAEASENIDLRILLRDEHPVLMDHFLTNGTRSIPKLIIIENDMEVCDTWGPRSIPATNMVKDYKEKFGKIDSEFKAQLQIWYNKDKGKNIINELADIVLETEIDEFISAYSF